MHRIDECIQPTSDGGGSGGQTYLEAFSFSIHVLSTVGYGQRAPSCVYSELVSAAQSFVGLLYMAFVTALLVTRLSRPASRLLLSDVTCVGVNQRGQRVLEFRAANAHHAPFLCADVSAVLSMSTPGSCQSYHRLKLEHEDEPGWLAQARIYTHIIDKASPLHDVDASNFRGRGAAIHVSIKDGSGTPATGSVAATGSYGAATGGSDRRVLFGSQFAAMTSRSGDAEECNLVFNYALLSAHETVCSSRATQPVPGPLSLPTRSLPGTRVPRTSRSYPPTPLSPAR